MATESSSHEETDEECDALKSSDNPKIQLPQDVDGCTAEQGSIPAGLSKRKMKKLRKTQKWEENKLRKRAEERARKKERRKVAREQGLEIGPSRKSLKRVTMAGSSCHQRVVVDCSFDDLMNDKDIANIVRQVNHCYAINRRTENPVQFYVTGVEKKMKARLDSLKDSKFWDVNFSGESYLAQFNKSEVVYLSSDSNNILDSLDDKKVYVIGGLIDHNHHKGLCLKLAKERGLSHARLPIADYVQFNSRKVLTVNQVFEILVGYTEKKDWEYAFLKAIPKRKDAIAKRTATEEESAGNTKKQMLMLCASDTNDIDLKEIAHSTGSSCESAEVGVCVTSKAQTEGASSNSCTKSCDRKDSDSNEMTDTNIGACAESNDANGTLQAELSINHPDKTKESVT